MPKMRNFINIKSELHKYKMLLFSFDINEFQYYFIEKR